MAFDNQNGCESINDNSITVCSPGGFYINDLEITSILQKTSYIVDNTNIVETNTDNMKLNNII